MGTATFVFVVSALPETGAAAEKDSPLADSPSPVSRDKKGETLKGTLGVIYKGYIGVKRVLGLGVPSRGPSYCPLRVSKCRVNPRSPTPIQAHPSQNP